MSELAQVRAEIKSWERDFASAHGRDPSVQDIRDQPAIADKYRRYKKLSKALPAPKSRPAASASPLPGFNPFSPVKKAAAHTPTPARNKPNPRLTPPTLPQHPDPSSSHGHGPPASTTAVSRARKRLRGEPVSPSPNKPKRQRIRSQAHPPITNSDQESSNSEHEPDQELPRCDFTSSFVADSPVKAPLGGKSFRLLFDDALPALSLAKTHTPSSAARLDSDPDARFSQRASADHPTLEPRYDIKSKGTTSAPDQHVNHTQMRGKQIFPMKDHLPAPSHKPAFKSALQVEQQRMSMKRALDGGDLPLIPRCPLIPPSPPPPDSVNRDIGRGKANSTASRKKLRVEYEESDEGVDSPDDITFKVATVSLDRSKHQHADDLEWDPLLHVRAHNHDPAATEQIDANYHAPDTFTVDLPDKLRRMLAIPPSRSQNSAEERVVRGLLYGDRVGHYDPSRGGPIWDAGETHEGALGDAETEDDWEGEPVPWEVGEL